MTAVAPASTDCNCVNPAGFANAVAALSALELFPAQLKPTASAPFSRTKKPAAPHAPVDSVVTIANILISATKVEKSPAEAEHLVQAGLK